jgi:DNA-binding transcriptional LysR family regulator
MQTQWLSYFLVLSQSKSFSETAQQLGLNSSTLSRKMKQLEQELGVELFSRFNRPLTLTTAGEHFLKQVPQLLKTLYQIEHLHLDLQQRSLMVAWFGSWGVYVLPRLISAFQVNFPNHRIESHSLSPEDAIELFDSGLLDLWLTTYQVNNRQIMDCSSLTASQQIEVWGGPISDFVIVGKPGPVQPWQNYQYIDLSLMTFDTPIWDESLFPRQIKVSLTSVSDAIALCCHSELVSFLPRMMVAPLLENQTLAIRAEAPIQQTIRPGILLNHASLGQNALRLTQDLVAAGFQAE